MAHKPELTLGAVNALREHDAVGREWSDIIDKATEFAAKRGDDVTRRDIERAIDWSRGCSTTRAQRNVYRG